VLLGLPRFLIAILQSNHLVMCLYIQFVLFFDHIEIL
jgi:hypothetical protein